MEKNNLITFEDKNIRRVWHNDEWFYSIVDIIEALTDSSIPKRYWTDLKSKLKFEGFETYGIIVQLKLKAFDGKLRLTDCVNNKGAFRLIQSIPSKKAEPFKQWLAKLGQDRIEEIQNPEIGISRNLDYYLKKGYSKNWVSKRKLSIITRKKLTNEWKNRGIKNNKDFAFLTHIIHNGTFDVSVKKHKNLKSISKKDELRDHMSDIELALISLSEATTTQITKNENSQDFNKLSLDAKDGSKVGKDARINIEKRLGKSIIDKSNFHGENNGDLPD